MNYYPFHIGDFRSGTVNMTRIARWIYRDMIDLYYDSEKPLPLDLDLLCHEIGVESDEEIKIVERLLRFKFRKTDDGYVNDICEKVIEEYRQKAKTAKTNGQLGGRPKKAIDNPNKPSGFPLGSDSDAIGKQQESQSKTNQEPITTNQEPVVKTKAKAKVEPSASPMLPIFATVPIQVIEDYKKLRKAKGKPITETAMQIIEAEALKCGITFADAITVCCEEGWAGFKSQWYLNLQAEKRQQSPAGGNRPTTATFETAKERSGREFYEAQLRLMEGLHHDQPDFIDINPAPVSADANSTLFDATPDFMGSQPL